MDKFVFSFALVCLLAVCQARKIYYPDTDDPNAIVFEGPTNFKDDVTTNEVIPQDYAKLIDVRQIKDIKDKDDDDEINENCPDGYEMVGEVCFPND